MKELNWDQIKNDFYKECCEPAFMGHRLIVTDPNDIVRWIKMTINFQLKKLEDENNSSKETKQVKS